MAKNMLPVDFRDDILSESMNNRRRYQMINNSDGTVSFVDVTEYEQVGSVFGQAQINAICAAVNGLTDSVSDAFSEEKNYEVGDYAIYENILYRFTAEKTAGAWNPAAAEAVTVAGELDKLNGNLILDYANAVTIPIKNNIGVTISTKGMLFPYNFRYSGQETPYVNIHINNTHIAIVNFSTAGRELPGPFPVSPGDIVKITISGGSADLMISDWKLVPCKNNN